MLYACKTLTRRARARGFKARLYELVDLEWCNVVMEAIGVKEVIEAKVVIEVIGVTYIT